MSMLKCKADWVDALQVYIPLLSGYRGQMSSGRKYGLLTLNTRIFYILLERSSKHPTHQAQLGQSIQ